MPQFFLQQCGAASDGKLTAVATCNTQAIVAAAREPNVVAFYNDQGEQLGERVTFTSSVSKLAWQPHGLVLAVGCEDGPLHRVGARKSRMHALAAAAGVLCPGSIFVMPACGPDSHCRCRRRTAPAGPRTLRGEVQPQGRCYHALLEP
jgi:hypothetical protein